MNWFGFIKTEKNQERAKNALFNICVISFIIFLMII